MPRRRPLTGPAGRPAAWDQRGAVVVLWAATVAAAMAMAALVIDLGHQRATRRAARLVTDLAALAAGPALTDSDPQEACRQAWAYVQANAADLAAVGTALDCSVLGTAAACSNVAPVPREARVTGNTGPYTVTFRYPVADADIALPRFAGSVGALDGKPCQRMSVSVRRRVPTFFARVFGVGELSAGASSVVRANGTSSKTPPALWFLDPRGCPGLEVSGGSQLTLGTTGAPGILVADSDGTGCSGTQTTIGATGAGTLLRVVPQTGIPAEDGSVHLFAMPRGATACSDGLYHDCTAADVASGRISPQPVPLPARSTRAPVDWRYNCRTGYPTYHGVTVDDCPDVTTTPAYVDRLRSAVGTAGAPAADYQQWSRFFSCSPAGLVVAPGNWWVDCPALTLNGGAGVTFTGGNVVFDGDVKVSSGTLAFNTANPVPNLPTLCLPTAVVVPCVGQSSQNAAFVYQRNGGNFTTEGGSGVTFNRTFLYQSTAGARGYFGAAGNSPPVWSAPLEGPFADLALWSETPSNKYQITGGAAMDLRGVFFTPEAAPFSLSGGSPVRQQNAQFITFRLKVSGGAVLTMAPRPNQAVAYLPPSATLIR